MKLYEVSGCRVTRAGVTCLGAGTRCRRFPAEDRRCLETQPREVEGASAARLHGDPAVRDAARRISRRSADSGRAERSLSLSAVRREERRQGLSGVLGSDRRRDDRDRRDDAQDIFGDARRRIHDRLDRQSERPRHGPWEEDRLERRLDADDYGRRLDAAPRVRSPVDKVRTRMTRPPWSRKLRMGMIGGGQGAFIGGVHRLAAALDGQIDLVAGVFSRDWNNTQTTGRNLYLDPARVYRTADAMAAAEAKRPASDRIDFVSIVTPNDAHFGPAKAFLEAGFHVVCDKPLAKTLAEAEEPARVVERTGRVFALTHSYTGYPLVRHARQLFQSGEMGVVRKVIVEYLQDWLMEPLEKQGSKQAGWRTDPAQSGIGGALGDIGTHALNLLEFVTGDRVADVCADLTTFLPDRKLDEDVNALLRMKSGGKGVLTVSQIATGEENALRLRVYASKGATVWSQENPNYMDVYRHGQIGRASCRERG